MDKIGIRACPSDSTPILIVGGFFPLPVPIPLYLCDSILRRRGRRVWSVQHSMYSMYDIRRRAKKVAMAARRLLSDTGAGRLDMLCYSMGGLVALYAVQNLGLAGKIRNFVAFGAPFQGTITTLALTPIFTYVASVWQMLPGSPLITGLQARGLPPGPRYVSISGGLDLMCPAPCAWLPGAENVILPFGHLDFFFTPELHRQIAPYLDRR